MRPYGQYCGLALALDRIGDRWTLLVVRELLTGPKRFSDLLAGLPGVATNLLAGRLKALESAGVVEQKRLPPPAASTTYALTELGRALEPAVHALVQWGGHFMRQRARGQAFRPHWLAVALQALLARFPATGESLVVEIVMPEGNLRLSVSQNGVQVISGEQDPDVRLRGRPELVLGWASGEIDWKAATGSGLAISGSKWGRAVLRSLFEVPSRGAPRARRQPPGTAPGSGR